VRPRSKYAGGLPNSGTASPLLLRAGPLLLRASELKPHTLVRICGRGALRTATGGAGGASLPTWVAKTLRHAPWVVVRRPPIHGGLVPVGVRGELRQQRFAAWLSLDEALEVVTPQALASCRSTRAVPALTGLPRVERIMCEHGLAGRWGPAGSVGFELASGRPTVTASSDLDLVLEVDRPELIADRLPALWTELTALPVRVDVLLETAAGAVVLSEYVLVRRGEGRSFVLRTPTGPRLMQSAAISSQAGSREA